MTFKKQHIFESLDQFLNAVTEGKPQWENPSSEKVRDDFYGKENFAQCVNLARFGWADGLKKLTQGLRDNVATMSQQERSKRMVSSPAGCIPIVPAAIMGLPESMLTLKRTASFKPTACLYIERAIAHWVTIPQLQNVGAAVLSVIDAMESAGVSVEAYVTFTASDGYDSHRSWFQTVVKFKDAGQPLDIDRAAFAMIHHGMVRRLYWRLIENAYPTVFNGHYGIHSDLPPYAFPSDAISISVLRDMQQANRANTREGALDLIIDQINASGKSAVIEKPLAA